MTPAAPAESEGLVGRRAEIDVLQSFVERAGVSGEALVLVGEAGVGKTALLDVAARRAVSLAAASSSTSSKRRCSAPPRFRSSEAHRSPCAELGAEAA